MPLNNIRISFQTLNHRLFLFSFGASSLDFELRVWISDVDMRLRVKSELLLFIDQQFRDAGVEIPFPQRDLHLRSISDDIISACKGGPVNSEPAASDE